MAKSEKPILEPELVTAIDEYIAVRKACQAEYDRIKDSDPDNASKVWEPEKAAFDKFMDVKLKYYKG